MTPSSAPNVLAMGGCQLHGPIRSLRQQKLVSSLYREIGFSDTPFVFTPSAALQLIEFCRGNLRIPQEIRRFCYSDSDCEPTKAQQTVIDQADIVLLEPNTSIDIVFESFCLNQTIVQQLIVERAKSLGKDEGKLAYRWRLDGIQKQHEEARRDLAAALRKVLPNDTEEDRMALAVVDGARGRETGLDDMRRGISDVRDAFGKPMGVVFYTFRYMPDARPISWPPDLKDNVAEAARQLGLMTYEPNPLVAHYGTEVALRDDVRHYKDEFYPVVATELMVFIEKIMGKRAAA